MKDVIAITDHCKRKTVTVTDASPSVNLPKCTLLIEFKVIFALRRQGRPIYGFDRTGTESKNKK